MNVWDRIMNRRGRSLVRKRSLPHAPTWCTPCFEALEDRVTPSTLHWTGSASMGGNHWSVAANWQEARVPVSGDALVFDTATAGFAATFNGFNSINDVVSLQNLTIAINDASSAGD